MCAASPPAYAEVFKCKQGDGKVVYQDYPCKGNPNSAPMDLLPDQPTYRDRVTAYERAAAEREFVQGVEAERDRNKALARVEESSRTKVAVRNDEQCNDYTAKADRIEKQARNWWYPFHYREQLRNQARALRDKYFRECLGSR
ncbi:DUF4124 domain-containing protein [Aromatoleum petrolei]|uniref:DUF4124 domain-containing protein n=1 Tax=Aromatoleum petrolei TaxID=76116 RepID=A0ABX1MTQ4_9RHOO|nr:DUF4124 domain-containing protein [Aromatoleum petrolei]NMF90610.1 DUF4124 domain-containing protein [Aromatoleum petrolei]QTQ37148.1 putative protein DUF4124 [Aromatoleum petrolei]